MFNKNRLALFQNVAVFLKSSSATGDAAAAAIYQIDKSLGAEIVLRFYTTFYTSLHDTFHRSSLAVCVLGLWGEITLFLSS